MDWPFWGATLSFGGLLLIVWQWQRIARRAKDLGTMSREWVFHRDRHRELPPR